MRATGKISRRHTHDASLPQRAFPLDKRIFRPKSEKCIHYSNLILHSVRQLSAAGKRGIRLSAGGKVFGSHPTSEARPAASKLCYSISTIYGIDLNRRHRTAAVLKARPIQSEA
jgi:hypothetical protein